jgi:hypothetical protein
VSNKEVEKIGGYSGLEDILITNVKVKLQSLRMVSQQRILIKKIESRNLVKTTP